MDEMEHACGVRHDGDFAGELRSTNPPAGHAVSGLNQTVNFNGLPFQKGGAFWVIRKCRSAFPWSTSMTRKYLVLAALLCGTVLGLGGCLNNLLFFVAPFLT